ncbi:TetR/AcrR family transcriptional regulator [Aestuariimicrobium soli]|uniref:TetR/AcrR family transcriptional regulator n=1 Tax=Aestuariimicrobium soli TaxID=2035834 RepID=UPI003EBA02CB
MALTRDEVLTTALAIVDEYGLADLTMRRLAAQLDVQAGALYYHVANKQTLLVALADLVLADPVVAGLEPATDPVEWGMALHAALRRHRSGAELVSAALAMRPLSESPAKELAALLADPSGDPHHAPTREALAHEALAHGVVNLVLGHTLDEEQRDQFARLGVGSDPSPSDARQSAARLRVALVRLVGR